MKKAATILLFFAIYLVSAHAQTSHQAQKRLPDDNHAYVLLNHSGYALDIEGGETNKGTNVRLWERNDSRAQQFRIVMAPDGYYYLLNEKSGKMLDVSGGKNNHGDNMQIWVANSDKAQKFKIIYAGSGYYHFQPYDSDYFISPQYSNPSKGTNVILWNKSQMAKWKFVRM